MSSLHQEILENLSGRPYGVNALVAINGIDDTIEGLKALKELVESRVVLVKYQTFEGKQLALYQKNWMHNRFVSEQRSQLKAVD